MPKVTKNETEIEVRLGLDPDEREPLTNQLLAELDEIDKLRKESKQAAATYRKTTNERIKVAEDLRTTLEQGKPVMRKVLEIKDFANGTVKYKDIETGKYYKDQERPINDDDSQVNLSETDLHEGDDHA